MSVRIKCINKDKGNHENPHEAINNFGWINEITNVVGNSTMKQMVDFLEENSNNNAYVKDYQGNVAYCYVRTSKNGNKFLQTVTDAKYSDNLLGLTECN